MLHSLIWCGPHGVCGSVHGNEVAFTWRLEQHTRNGLLSPFPSSFYALCRELQHTSLSLSSAMATIHSMRSYNSVSFHHQTKFIEFAHLDRSFHSAVKVNGSHRTLDGLVPIQLYCFLKWLCALKKPSSSSFLLTSPSIFLLSPTILLFASLLIPFSTIWFFWFLRHYTLELTPQCLDGPEFIAYLCERA